MIWGTTAPGCGRSRSLASRVRSGRWTCTSRRSGNCPGSMACPRGTSRRTPVSPRALCTARRSRRRNSAWWRRRSGFCRIWALGRCACGSTAHSRGSRCPRRILNGSCRRMSEPGSRRRFSGMVSVMWRLTCRGIRREAWTEHWKTRFRAYRHAVYSVVGREVEDRNNGSVFKDGASGGGWGDRAVEKFPRCRVRDRRCGRLCGGGARAERCRDTGSDRQRQGESHESEPPDHRDAQHDRQI